MNRQEIITDVVARIRTAQKVHAIIMFGSYAYGDPNDASDLDLIVVLDKNTCRNSYDEMTADYLTVSRALRGIKKRVPIDLLVYSIPEYRRFIDSKSLFARKIAKEGVILA